MKKMSECVPGWDVDDNMKLTSQSDSLYLSPDVPTLDYEVAELTWENGQLSMHGLGQPRQHYDIWDKQCLGGTLESIVDHKSVGDGTDELVPWTTTGLMDALVIPCTNNNNNNKVVEGCSTRVIESSLGMQRETFHEERKKKTNDKSTKRRRAAAMHNQSERKRRDKINQRMQTLQKMLPNSSKIDKASMLDEVIDYMKQLQAQVGMMNMSPMTLPNAMQQQLQMSMNAAMACHPNMVAPASPSFVAHRLHCTPAPPMLHSMATLYQHMNQNPGPGLMK